MEKKSKILIIVCVIMQLILIVGVAALFIQNTKLADTVKQYVASNGDIHDIYDDSEVVKAYQSGDEDGLNEQDKYVLKKAKEVIKENIKDGMTDYEKEKAIYDWQVEYVAYNDQNLAPISAGDQYSHLPYGVLKYHQAICVGNATTFKLFMDLLGIENQIIHSTEDGEHAWNLVKLDGDWYHSDVTFDGGINGKPAYTNFNVPDSVKDDGSYPWNHEVIPAADGTKYCYLANEAKELKDIYALPKYIKQQLNKGTKTITFTLKDSTGYTQSVADYITSALATGDGDMYTNPTLPIGSKNIYVISVENYDDQNADEASQKIINKLQEIIDGLQ
ncbi:transglutaminase domain-containing protein [Emergencia sp.]|uniref:transglutaminase domain-containing protein n=1 Tax=Emergencia sp. TaxID=1926557 RepID=UPI003AEFF1FA